MRIFKDYQIVQRKLCKFAVDEKKHLLWKYGGVPAIDKELWDKLMKGDKRGKPIDWIYIRTKKSRRFQIAVELFDARKKEIDLGFGKQYVVEKEYWEILAPEPKKPKEPVQLPLSNRTDEPPMLDEEDFTL